MDVNKLREKYPTEVHNYQNNDSINPARLFEHYYFNQPWSEEKKDYRDTAIDKCIEEKLSFESTDNNIFELCKRFVHVTCPICGSVLEGSGGGGTCDNYHIDYRCKCGFKASLNMHTEGISFEFKEE